MPSLLTSRPLPPVLTSLSAFIQRNALRLRFAGCLILAGLIGKLAAQLVWALIPLPASAAWQPLPVPSRSTASSAGPDLGALSAAQLFGRYQAVPLTNTDALASAPETQLNLTLLGILAGDKFNSRALIATQDAEEKPYGIGDSVVRGTVLQAIFPDRVVLARGARLETLRLDKDKASPANVPALAEEPPPDPDRMTSLADVRSKLLTDPSKVDDYIRINPVNANGEQHGYRVFPGKDRALFGPSGLRPGDVVTSVNGVELDDPTRALQLLGQLAQTPEITVVLERSGQSQTLRIPLTPP
jgi:general secretion pathway protein C